MFWGKGYNFFIYLNDIASLNAKIFDTQVERRCFAGNDEEA